MKYLYLFLLSYFACFSVFGQTTTYNYTGTVQTYTVPSGVTSITVDVQGAKGGGVMCSYGWYQSVGGCGGRVQATLSVTPGHVLYITVGGQGASSSGTGGYGGGGSDPYFSSTWPGAGGGGGTKIVDNTTGTLLAVAGGGGGAGGDFCSSYGIGTGAGDNGGAGGGLTGATGNCNICGYGTGGLGGTQTSGGAGGTCSGTGGAGSLGTGGSCSGSTLASGGGGGGYYGGGSGSESGGGGGGSSYTNATYASAITHTQGYTCGNGLVVINVACTPPPSITGATFSVCVGSTITLADATSGGTWTSSATGTASVVSTSGVVTGVSAGTATITYTVGGCNTTATVTVNGAPVGISGTTVLCAGTTSALVDASGTGTWTSSSTSVATVGSTTGIVSGVSSGTSTIIFVLTSTGCSTSTTVTVNPAPASISGTVSLCQGNTVTLSDATSGGTWSSAASGIAFINPSTGVMTGVSGGTTTISYIMTSGGCYATATVTVNPLPSAISGASTVCLGATTVWTDATGGGTWSSSAPSIASVGSTTGIVTGNVVGTTTITYSLTATGCYITKTITVNPLPGSITGTLSVCVNSLTTLSNSVSGGTWSSSLGSIGSISSTGVVTGNIAGTTTITYQLGTGCYATATLTVLPLPAPITGTASVCVGSSTTLSDATGGATWSITGSGATIGTTGIVSGLTAGVDTVKYTITATGCLISVPVTVNPLPAAIAGVTVICDSTTSYMLDATPGGTWSSSNTSVCSVGLTTGIAYGASVGTATLTYQITATGCLTTLNMTIQPPPAPVTGTLSLCPGYSTTLSDAITGGYWLSGTTTVATIDSFTGAVSALTSGTTMLTYVLGTCSTTKLFTVNPFPSTITGTTYVCVGGASTTLYDGSLGGTWTSGNISVATVATTASSSGIVTSSSVGTVTMTYTLPTGCYTTGVVTVEPLPAAISGSDAVCLGYTTTLTDASSGGTFSSATPSIASVVSGTGVVTGISAGSTIITYTLTSTGCQITVPFMVNPILAVSNHILASTGDTVCAGHIVTYTATSSNGGTSPVYHWTVNNVPVGGTANVFSYAPANGDVVKCVVTSDATCAIPSNATSNLVTMTVNPVTNPTVTMFPAHNDTICTGTTKTFNVTSTYGGTSPVYLWTINWVPVATNVLTYTYMPTNGDIVRCGMISSSPCPVPDTAFAIDTIVVKNYDTPKVVILNMDGSSVCQGNPVTLFVNPQFSGWGPSFHWTINGAGVAGTTSYTYYPNNNDSVNVTMISNYPCAVPSDTASDSYKVKVDSIIKVEITGRPGMLITRGSYDTLTANIEYAGDAPTFQWYVNGVIVPGATNETFISGDLKDKDSVSCVVRTGSGSACEGLKGHNWMVIVAAPAGLSGAVGEVDGISLIPNPNNGTFVIEGNVNTNDKYVQILISNVIGQIVHEDILSVSNGKLNNAVHLVHDLPSGIYTLRIVSESESKLIKFALTK